MFIVADGDGQRLDGDSARAGSTEHVVRYVLGISLALAIVAMVVVLLIL